MHQVYHIKQRGNCVYDVETRKNVLRIKFNREIRKCSNAFLLRIGVPRMLVLQKNGEFKWVHGELLRKMNRAHKHNSDGVCSRAYMVPFYEGEYERIRIPARGRTIKNGIDIGTGVRVVMIESMRDIKCVIVAFAFMSVMICIMHAVRIS